MTSLMTTLKLILLKSRASSGQFLDQGKNDSNDPFKLTVNFVSLYRYRRRVESEDDDDDCMESSYAQMMREEVRSAKIGTTIASFREVFGIYDLFVRITGLEEDLEDIRREEEEKRMKLAKRGGKRK